MLDYNLVVNSFIKKNRDIKEEFLIIGDYEITYYRQRDNRDFVIFDNDDSLIHFQSKEDLKRFIMDNVINGNKRFPDIDYKKGDLLKNYLDNVAYHISPVGNRNKILENGLIPNGENSLEVLPTSIYLDMYRIKGRIPKDFYKSLSIYLYPEYYLTSTENISVNSIDLYGVDISGLDWMIGSQSLSGNCMVNCNILDNDIVTKEEDRIKEAKTYWKNCYSKKEYLVNSDRVAKSEKHWGLDEILYCGIVDISRIKLIGTWSSDNLLWYFYDDIKSFVREDYQNDYKDILRKINRNQILDKKTEIINQSNEQETFYIKEMR